MTGLRCPNHPAHRTLVIDTRHYPGYTRRRRKCPICDWRFTTRETIDLDPAARRTGAKRLDLPPAETLYKYYQELGATSVARRLGCSVSTVYSRIKEAGYDLDRERQRPDRDVLDRIRALKEAGWLAKEIAGEVGLTVWQVYYWWNGEKQ